MIRQLAWASLVIWFGGGSGGLASTAWGQATSAPPPPPSSAPSLSGPAAAATKPLNADDAKKTSQVAARVLARVNGQPILLQDVENAAAMKLEYIRPQVPDEQWPSVRGEVLDAQLKEIIDNEVILQEAFSRVRASAIQSVIEYGQKEFDKKLRAMREQLHVRSDVELKQYFEKRGYNFEEMRRQYARAYTAMEFMRNLVRDRLDLIDRKELLQYYRDHPDEFKRQELITWQHIYLDSSRYPSRLAARQHAEQMQQMVFAMHKKEDFAAIAQQYSHSPDRYQGGENQDPPGQIRPPEVQEVILRMQPGQTGPVIESDNGFHVVRKLAHQPGGMIPFAEVCQDIRNKLQGKIGMDEFQKELKRLREKAYVEYLTGKEKE